MLVKSRIQSRTMLHWFVLYTCVCQLLSHAQFFVTPRTVAGQAPLSMEFSRQEYWSGLPFPSPGDLPDPGIEPASPAVQAASLPSEPSTSVNLRECHCAPRFTEREPTSSHTCYIPSGPQGLF